MIPTVDDFQQDLVTRSADRTLNQASQQRLFPAAETSDQPVSSAACSPETILRASELAKQRLARFARSSPTACQVTYLFAQQHYQSIRWTAEPFSAAWTLGEPEIQFFRGRNPIGTVAIDPPQRRAA